MAHTGGGGCSWRSIYLHGCAVVMSPQLGTDPWEPNAVILPDGSCCFLNATKRVLKLEICAVRQKLSLLLAKSSLDEYPDWWRSPGLAKCSEFVVLMFSTLPLISTLLFQEVICAFFSRDLSLSIAFGRKKCLSACFSSQKLLSAPTLVLITFSNGGCACHRGLLKLKGTLKCRL